MAVPHYGVDLIKWALSISRYTENRISRGFNPLNGYIVILLSFLLDGVRALLPI